MLDNPPQVAAEEFGSACMRYLAPGPRNDRLAITLIFVIPDIVGRIAIGEALRKNLVKDGVVYPCWCVVVREDAKIRRVGRRIAHHPGGSKPPVALVCQEKKAVVVSQHPDVDIPFPPARGRVFRGQLQRSHVLLAIGVGANENAFNWRIEASTHAELYG